MKRTMIAFLMGLGILGLLTTQALAQSTSGASAATKENLDLPFDAVGSSEDEEDAPEIVVFYGQQYEGDGFFFCCDRSSSMEGLKWKRLQQEVVKNISQFSDKVEFSIVFFDANIIAFPPSGRPAEASPALKAAGIAMVMSSTTGHGTCAKAALIKTLNYANQSSAKRKTIVFLSDGYWYCNGQDLGTYTNSTLAEVTARNTQRAHINALCIGQNDNVSEEPMRRMASQNQGQYARLVQ